MSQEEPEIGRFEPKGNPGEPREPFLPGEIPEQKRRGIEPSVAALHVPKAPISKEALKSFLIELGPIIREIQQLKRKDQHLVGKFLNEVKLDLHAGDLPEEIVRGFEKIARHFNDLLTHSRPTDREEAFKSLKELESKL